MTLGLATEHRLVRTGADGHSHQFRRRDGRGVRHGSAGSSVDQAADHDDHRRSAQHVRAAGKTGPTLHVAPDGDDAAAGDTAKPLRTITAAAERARPGTTVLVRDGRYDGDIVTRTSGTADARIVFVAQSPQVRIVGAG